MGKVFDRAANVVLVLATAVCAVILVRRELQPKAARSPSGPPEYVDQWQDAIPIAATVGRTNAPIQLIVFTDFECPYCRKFHESVLPLVLRAFPDSVGLRVVPGSASGRGRVSAVQAGDWIRL